MTTKVVLLKSVVPSTYDGGFRAAGYMTVASIEVPEDVDIKASLLERLISEVRKAKTVKAITERKGE